MIKIHNYKNGVLDGLYQIFYDTGKIKIEGNYENGDKHGTFNVYDGKGKIVRRKIFDKGERILIDSGNIIDS